jgi:hypothetical protein
MLRDSTQDPFAVPTARVLLLMLEFDSRRTEGLTVAEIARIDFLLRHPPLLAQAAAEAGKPLAADLTPTLSERLIAEHAALRVRYGPWDERYRLVVGRLLALDLVRPSIDQDRFMTTSAAQPVAASLCARGWDRTARHAAAAARVLVDADIAGVVRRLVTA